MNSRLRERWLAIETSSPRLSLAVGTENGVLRHTQGPLRWRHAEALFAGCEKLLRALKWKPSELTGVAVSVGPGSFTGIRIGMAAARALGQTIKIPVVGISALETIAAGIEPRDGAIAPIINAFGNGVFSAIYQGSKRRLTCIVKEGHFSWEEWSGVLKDQAKRRPLWLAGDALRAFEKEIKALRGRRIHLLPEKNWYPRADVLLRLAAPRLKKAGASSYRSVAPVYLRKAAAQERIAR